MGALGLLNETKAPVSQKELADLLIKDAPTTSRILDILIKNGYVERKPDKNDRRKFNVALTADGKDLGKSITPVVADIRREIFKGLKRRDFEELDRLIIKIMKKLE